METTLRLKDYVRRYPETEQFLKGNEIRQWLSADLPKDTSTTSFSDDQIITRLTTGTLNVPELYSTMEECARGLSSPLLVRLIRERFQCQQLIMMERIHLLFVRMLFAEDRTVSEEIRSLHHVFVTLRRDLEEEYQERRQFIYPLFNSDDPLNPDMLYRLRLGAEHNQTTIALLEHMRSIGNNYLPEKSDDSDLDRLNQALRDFSDSVFLSIYVESGILYPRFSKNIPDNFI